MVQRWLRPIVLAFVAALVVLGGEVHARAAGALPSPGEYVVDSRASSVGFNVTEFLVNTVHGKFKTFAGKVLVGDSFATSQIEATVDLASIDTGTHMRDDHLRGPDYFDVARFPRMTFTSTQIWGSPDNFGIKGNLTIKGVTKDVVFSARIQDGGLVLAEARIDRTDFGILAGGTIKNEVRLRLEIRLTKSAPQP